MLGNLMVGLRYYSKDRKTYMNREVNSSLSYISIIQWNILSHVTFPNSVPCEPIQKDLKDIQDHQQIVVRLVASFDASSPVFSDTQTFYDLNPLP